MSEMTSSPTVLQKCSQWEVAAQARASGTYPFFRPITEARGSKVIIEGRELIMAGSNDYLGLATDERERQRLDQARLQEPGLACRPHSHADPLSSLQSPP